jgi:WD40 repeat protein
VYLWNATTGEQHATLRGHVASVRSVAWSPDGRRLGSSGHDGTIRIWDPLAAQELISLPLSNEVRALKIGMCLRWSPDGKSLACAVTDGTIRVWDASRGYTLAEQPAGWQPPFTGIREFATSSGTTGDLSVGLDAPASIAPKRDR